jgi:hypothetical protein
MVITDPGGRKHADQHRRKTRDDHAAMFCLVADSACWCSHDSSPQLIAGYRRAAYRS